MAANNRSDGTAICVKSEGLRSVNLRLVCTLYGVLLRPRLIRSDKSLFQKSLLKSDCPNNGRCWVLDHFLWQQITDLTGPRFVPNPRVSDP